MKCHASISSLARFTTKLHPAHLAAAKDIQENRRPTAKLESPAPLSK